MLRRGLTASILVVGLFVAARTVAGAQRLPTHMVLHDRNWTVSLTQPEGWLTDTATVSKFPGTVYHRASDIGKRATDIITIQFQRRDYQSAQQDLEEDVARYRKGWPQARFADFRISANHGKAFGKTYYLTDTHEEQVVYIDPGPATPCYFIVTLVSFDRPPPADARSALQTIVRSLLYVATTPI